MGEQPIGFLDSGLGGLSVIKEVKKLLPRENIDILPITSVNPMVRKIKMNL